MFAGSRHQRPPEVLAATVPLGGDVDERRLVVADFTVVSDGPIVRISATKERDLESMWIGTCRHRHEVPPPLRCDRRHVEAGLQALEVRRPSTVSGEDLFSEIEIDMAVRRTVKAKIQFPGVFHQVCDDGWVPVRIDVLHVAAS